MDNKKIFSIVVPCYNERKNIPFVLDKFAKVIDRNDIEIIFVDNGSVDGSSEVLYELLPKYLFAETIRLEVNQGYGFGILSGLKRAKGEFLGWMHGDMQTDPMDIIKAIEIIERSNNKNIFVKGRRKGRALFDQIFTIGMSFFETFLLRTFLWDINAQPNIFNRKLFESWRNPPYDFSLDLFALYSAKKQGYEIKRFFVTFPKRIYGMSHWNTGIFAKWKFIKRTLSFSFKLISNTKNINKFLINIKSRGNYGIFLSMINAVFVFIILQKFIFIIDGKSILRDAFLASFATSFISAYLIRSIMKSNYFIVLLIAYSVFCSLMLFSIFTSIFIDRSLTYHTIFYAVDKKVISKDDLDKIFNCNIYKLERIKDMTDMGMLRCSGDYSDGGSFSLYPTKRGKVFSNFMNVLGGFWG